jgi:hypothetical protein
MASHRDRKPHILEQDDICLPHPPLNFSATSAFEKGVIDLWWSSPSELWANSKFNIIGVNIYRSFDSEYGPYFRLNTTPIGGNFWRDRTRTILALQEPATFIAKGPETGPDGRYIICTKNRPLVIYPSPGVANCTNLNVQVTVNGEPAFVQSIDAGRGHVELRTLPYFDVTSQEKIPAVLPESDDDVVLLTYRYLTNEMRTDLAQRIFYRATTVIYDDESATLMETPLDRAAQTNNMEVEKLDWIWREAIRRNKWVLNQGGERVKVFIRRMVGHRCGCYSEEHKRGSADCEVCLGTRIIGGYDGPYDIIIAPDDADKNITRTNRGLQFAHAYETWTGPSPLLSQRDFIVKQNGDRYGIGPVRMPSNRGMQLQQFFTISHIDEQDIRYTLTVPDTNYMRAPETRYIVPGEGDASPMVSEKENIPDERELRKHTVTGENITY